MQASATDYAWAAGFIDGEGSISVRRIWTAKLNRYVFQLYLRAAQVDEEPLLKLQTMFGGRVGLNAPRGKNDAPFYDWYLTSGKAAEAIEAMLPYLTLKKGRAFVGLEFQSNIKRGRMLKGTADSLLALQEAYWTRMHDLNLRYAQRRAAAETESRGSQVIQPVGSDSPVCIDSKDAEGSRNDYPLKLAVRSSRSA